MDSKKITLLLELLDEAMAHAPLPEGAGPYSGPAHLAIKETIKHLKTAQKIINHYEGGKR